MVMTTFEIGQYRLFNQGVTEAQFEHSGQVVAHLGAVQAQDYSGSLWAIGLRMKAGTTQALIEQSIVNRTIVRTWPMRGTLHFVAAADVRWLLKLLTPRIISASAARQRALQIDAQVLVRSQNLIVQALEGGKQLTRPQLYQILEQGNIIPTGQRGIHILGRLAQEGVLCLGSHHDKQPTFVLLDEWVSPVLTKTLERDEALAELAKRYFIGHGPATLPDLERWAGLKTSDARAGLEMVKSHLRREEVDGQIYWLAQKEPLLPANSPAVSARIHLLPGFDEYILGYKERSAVLDPQHFQKVVLGGNGVFMPTMVSNSGRVVGLWKRTLKKDKLLISPVPFDALSEVETAAFATAGLRYGEFMGMPV